jgi:sterol desaturase/sphingolipid hydroxylase (fatty acid hydroxylase superfamily)
MVVLIDKTRADILYYLTPLTLAAIAYFYSSDPKLHFTCFARYFATVWGSIMFLSALGEFVNSLFGFRKIQPGRDPKMYLQEIKGMTGTVFVMCQCIAWPMQFVAQGKPTAFVDTFQESMPFGSIPLFILKMLVITLAADAWTFWKHYSLHCRHLYAIHATHHAFYDPSIFAAFALHPFESLYTFAPIVMFCIPQIAVHGPTYIPYLACFGLLNLYLHSGVVYAPLEKILPFFFINTSAFHNAHHELTRTHFGEMLYFIDWLIGTDEMRQRNFRGLFNTKPWLQYFMKQPGAGKTAFLIRDPAQAVPETKQNSDFKKIDGTTKPAEPVKRGGRSTSSTKRTASKKSTRSSSSRKKK